MSREQERARRSLEQNPIAECNRIQRKYYPELFSRFAKVKDPRNQSYIDYSTKTMLGTLYYKCIGGISSMQEMNFWKEYPLKSWKKYKKTWHTQ